jgi:filamentous hemagglutinin
MGATASAGVGAAVQAGVTALASRAAVSFVNNNGDIGKVLEELGSSEGVKSIATAMVTAGVLQGLSEVLPDNLANATNGSAKFTDQLQRQLIDGAASAVVRSAINGTSLEDELRSGLTDAILNTVAAQSADGIGGLKYYGDINGFTQNVLHAIAGCAVGAARADSSSGCGAGALGAVIGELTANAFGRDEYGNVRPGAVEMTQVLAAIGGAVAGLDAEGINIAAASSANAAINNALSNRGATKLMSDLRACSSGTNKSCDVEKLRKEMTLDAEKQTARIERDCGTGGSLNQCMGTSTTASHNLQRLTEAYFYADTPEKKALVNGLIDQQLTDMTKMYETLEKQHSAAGAGELLKAAIVGALPYAGIAVGSMVGTKLGGTTVAKAPTGGKPSGGATCSFRGDMQVKTRSGYTQIKDIRVGDNVYARNELDGAVGYKNVLAQYSNPYKETVYVTAKDKNGEAQVIVSNVIHPFFAQVPGTERGTVLPKASEGHDYRGPILRAQWVDAANLKAGYRLLGSSGSWLEVTQVQRTTEPLKAYNLTVADFHTYFVKGEEGQEGVWVHNTCAYTADQLPNARPIGTQNANGRQEYTAVVNEGTRYQETRVFYKGVDGKYYDSLKTFDGKMLGIDGAQTASKPMWKGEGKSRIDVENPNPGQRAGQIHYQDENNKKYYYDANKKIFYNEKSMDPAPKKVQAMLDDKSFVKGLNKALSVLGVLQD